MPGDVVSAARLVRRVVFLSFSGTFGVTALIEAVAGNDLGAYWDPDHLPERARSGQEPVKSANGDAVGGTAAEGMVDVDHPGDAGLFCLEWKRSEGHPRAREFGRDTTNNSGSDKLRVAAPLIVAGIHPALKRFNVRAVDREIRDFLMFAGLSRGDRHACAECPEKQTEGDTQHDRDNCAKVP